MNAHNEIRIGGNEKASIKKPLVWLAGWFVGWLTCVNVERIWMYVIAWEPILDIWLFPQYILNRPVWEYIGWACMKLQMFRHCFKIHQGLLPLTAYKYYRTKSCMFDMCTICYCSPVILMLHRRIINDLGGFRHSHWSGWKPNSLPLSLSTTILIKIQSHPICSDEFDKDNKRKKRMWAREKVNHVNSVKE